MTKKIGFLVNPIAGMGGKVGLKGTDDVLDEAVHRGAQPVAPQRAIEMLTEFQLLSSKPTNLHWYTCEGDMGISELKQAHIIPVDIIYKPHQKKTSSEDTKNACRQLLQKKVDIILFCGGDGTARDIFDIVGKNIPILGIPAGVKMHSAVFGITPKATAVIFHQFLNQSLTLGDAELMDLDEERYRKGEWNIHLFGIAKGIVEPTYIQVGKMSFESVSDEEIKAELAEHIKDEMDQHPEHLYLFGPVGTIDYIAKKMNLDHTLLGIDAVYQKKVIAKDLNEQKILSLLKKYPHVKLLLSPIGAQGFILGRGNLQLSPTVLRKINPENIIIVSTPAKLTHTPLLRVDTGDPSVDKTFQDIGYVMVVIGYRLSRIIKIQTNNF